MAADRLAKDACARIQTDGALVATLRGRQPCAGLEVEDEPHPIALLQLELDALHDQAPRRDVVATFQHIREPRERARDASGVVEHSVDGEALLEEGTRPRMVASGHNYPAERPEPVCDVPDVPELAGDAYALLDQAFGFVELPSPREHDADVVAGTRFRHQVACTPRDLEPFLRQRASPVAVTERQGGHPEESEQPRDRLVVFEVAEDGQAQLTEPPHRLVVGLHDCEPCDPRLSHSPRRL